MESISSRGIARNLPSRIFIPATGDFHELEGGGGVGVPRRTSYVRAYVGTAGLLSAVDTRHLVQEYIVFRLDSVPLQQTGVAAFLLTSTASLCTPDVVPSFAKEVGAVAVVTDMCPLRDPTRRASEVAEELSKAGDGMPLFQVKFR